MFDDYRRFKVQSGGKVAARVSWSRVAIDTAVLTAAIKVDRLVKKDVG